MGSSGYQFPLIVRVHGILGHRGISDHLISAEQLREFMEVYCDQLQLGGDHPSDATTRRWAYRDPDLPERALESKLIRVQMILPWARSLIGNYNAQMGQDLATSGQTANDSDSTLGDLAMAVGGAYLGVRFLNWLFNPPKRIERPEERRTESRIGRVSRRRGYFP